MTENNSFYDCLNDEEREIIITILSKELGGPLHTLDKKDQKILINKYKKICNIETAKAAVFISKDLRDKHVVEKITPTF